MLANSILQRLVLINRMKLIVRMIKDSNKICLFETEIQKLNKYFSFKEFYMPNIA